jgi:hypothetical protein
VNKAYFELDKLHRETNKHLHLFLNNAAKEVDRQKAKAVRKGNRSITGSS